MTLSIGLSLLGEAITCGGRGLQSGIPFSNRDTMRNGSDSSALNDLVDRVRQR
jgi:hypothetical protein